jgi:hypothetical protein
MKKEYLILVAIILVLSAYLVLHKEGRNNYTLPEINKIDREKITALTIEKGNQKIEFTKKEDLWVFTDKKYAAKLSIIKDMLDVFEKLKISALVSEKGDLKRYELDDRNRIKVIAKENDKTLIELEIGKTAPTYNHTFIMLKGDKNVYHANDSFRTYFDKTDDGFRNKKVFEFKEAAVSELTLEKNGIVKKLIAKDIKTDTEAIEKKWMFEDGTTPEKESFSDLLSSIAFLECDKFDSSGTKQDLASQPFILRITVSDKTPLVLTLFQSQGGKILKGISTMNGDVFSLSEFTGSNIMSNVDTLLGIKKEEAPKE